MIRVAIVEDDAEVQGVLQEYVRRYTRQYGTEFEVTVFADGVDILDDYRAVYDIIFLDVEMKHLDGMTTAERIRQMDADVILIFITNMAQYAIRGYSVGALDYVLKPVPYFAFSQQLLKAVARLEKRAKHYLTVPVEGGLRRLDTASIYYLESEGHRVHFYTDEGDFSAPGALKTFEEMLGVKNVSFRQGDVGALPYEDGSFDDWTSRLGPVLGREAALSMIQDQYSRLALPMLISYAGMFLLALTGVYAILSKKTILLRWMLAFNMIVLELVFVLIPDVRQLLVAGISTWDFVLSQCSGNAALFIWMTANAVWAGSRKETDLYD